MQQFYQENLFKHHTYYWMGFGEAAGNHKLCPSSKSVWKKWQCEFKIY